MFLDSALGSVFGFCSGMWFWILGSVLDYVTYVGFWREVFLDSGKCFVLMSHR